MKKFFFFALIAVTILSGVFSLSACSNKKSKVPVLVETQEEEPNNISNENNSVFLLKNNCGMDAYYVKFEKESSEPLVINGVLPAGNEVNVDASGKCVISAKFLNSDNSYNNITFGTADLDNFKTIVLDTDGKEFFISYE